MQHLYINYIKALSLGELVKKRHFQLPLIPLTGIPNEVYNLMFST